MKPMTNGTVQYGVDDGVASVMLDRPDTLNAMTNGLMDDLREAIETAEADADVRVLILTGNGAGFCAGADLKQFGDDRRAEPAPSDGSELSAMDAHFHPAVRALYGCRVPTIARVNGVAAGGGFGLALTCDITIAVESTFFVATFGPKLGIVPDMGTTWHLPMRLGRARALGMAMLGDRMPATEAAALGLIYAAVPDDALDDEVGRIAEQLKRSSNMAMTRIRSAIDRALLNGYSDQLEVEGQHQKVLIPKNMAEGAAAFVEKRDPVFDT